MSVNPETFTLKSQYPYTPVVYDGLKYRVDEIKSERAKTLERELLKIDRMSPDFITKRREYEQSANADFNALEARHPDYSPKFYQDERDWYKLLKTQL